MIGLRRIRLEFIFSFSQVERCRACPAESRLRKLMVVQALDFIVVVIVIANAPAHLPPPGTNGVRRKNDQT